MRFGLAWTSLLAFAVGCGGTDEPESSLEDGCDIKLADCQNEIFAATAEMREQSGATMPPVRTISVAEFRAWLEEEVAGEGMESDPWNAPLTVLGLLPEGSTIATEQVEAAVAGVAAYYQTETKAVTIIDRGPNDPIDDVFVLAHEFAHALQDASLDLEAFGETWEDSLDSSVAVSSLIEGEATVLGFGVVGKALDATPDRLNWTGLKANLRRAVFDEIEASPAPLFTAVQSLPYPLGTAQLAPLWVGTGQSAVDALYAAPPLSVLDWAEDTNVTSRSRHQALDCEPTRGPAGFAGTHHDSFGPIGALAALIGVGVDVDRAWLQAIGVRGDRVVLFHDEADSGRFAVAWRIRFESEQAAAAFELGIAPALAEDASSAVDGSEVLLFGSSDPAALSSWTEVSECGTTAELPAASPESGEGDSAWRRIGRKRGLALR
ncbi:MAG TPA: hypothetical protein VGK73_00990 [Polyangiaceae bacterium]